MKNKYRIKVKETFKNRQYPAQYSYQAQFKKWYGWINLIAFALKPAERVAEERTVTCYWDKKEDAEQIIINHKAQKRKDAVYYTYIINY